MNARYIEGFWLVDGRKEASIMNECPKYAQGPTVYQDAQKDTYLWKKLIEKVFR